MKNWTADFANDPYDGYNLIVEILYCGKDVAVVKRGKNGLEIKWYPTKEELVVPLDWLMQLLNYAKKRIDLYEN